MPRGATRTVSPKPYILEKLGMEMVEWVRKNKPLHLSEWYALEKELTADEIHLFAKKPEFKRYYEQAKALIGRSYLDGTVPSAIANRWQRVYFRDLRDEEDNCKKESAKLQLEVQKELMEHTSKLQSKQFENISEEHKECFERLMNNLEKMQLQSDFMIDKSKKSTA